MTQETKAVAPALPGATHGNPLSRLSPPTRRWLVRGAAAVFVFALLWSAAWFYAPPLIRSEAEKIGSDKLGRKVTLGAVTFNPWTLELTVLDVAIAAADAAAPPQLRIKRVTIDTAEGYRQLAAEEQRLEIKEPGEMTMIFGPIYLTSKGEQRYIEQCFAGAMKRLIGQMKGDNSFKGPLTVDVAAYAKEIFGAGVALKNISGGTEDPIAYHRVTREGKPLGWVVEAYHAIGCPICSDAQFVLATDNKLAITDLRPARELERWGAKLPDADKTKFVAQFKGKTPDAAPLKVDGISGATKTTLAYQATINEVLVELKKRAKNE